MRIATAVTAALIGVAWAGGGCGEAAAQGVGPHLGVGVLAGEAAGLDDGFTHFGGFVPLTQPDRQSLWFADANLLLFNEGSDHLGANAGVGYRRYCCATDSILGGYVYYDRRDLGVAEFDQIGAGFESLGDLVDFRLNVNTPIGDRTAGTITGVAPVGGGVAAQGVLFHSLQTLDAEVGYKFWQRGQTQLRAFVGVYGLYHEAIDDAAGVRGRFEARIADQLFVGAYLENDDEFDTTGAFTLEYRFGRGRCRNENSACCRLARLGDPVQRRRHIAVAERETSMMLTEGGEEIEIEYIDEDGDPVIPMAAGGLTTSSTPDGTAERPYTDLAAVATSTADIVYVVGGVYDGESLRVTQDGQRVWGGSQSYTIATDQGVFTIGAYGGQVVIRNAPGDAIRIDADNVTVAGFRVEDASGVGISAGGRQNLVIRDNTIIRGVGSSINLGAGATGTIVGNTIQNAPGDAIVLNSFTGSLVGNLVTASAASGAAIFGGLDGDLIANVFSNNGVDGANVTGAVTGAVTGNTFSDNGTTGLFVSGAVGGDVTGNTANDNGGDGIWVQGAIGGSTSPNTTTGNGGLGFRN